MADAAGDESSGRHEQVVELRKEASTMALYVAICLLAAFAALPETDAHDRVIGIIWGVTVGLPWRTGWRSASRPAWWAPAAFVHTMWSRRCPAGRGRRGGAAGVGSVILFPESIELELVELLLAAFIALVGFAVARGGGATRTRAMLYGLAVLVIAVAIALVENGLAGH